MSHSSNRHLMENYGDENMVRGSPSIDQNTSYIDTCVRCSCVVCVCFVHDRHGGAIYNFQHDDFIGEKTVKNGTKKH